MSPDIVTMVPTVAVIAAITVSPVLFATVVTRVLGKNTAGKGKSKGHGYIHKEATRRKDVLRAIAPGSELRM